MHAATTDPDDLSRSMDALENPADQWPRERNERRR